MVIIFIVIVNVVVVVILFFCLVAHLHVYNAWKQVLPNPDNPL